MNIAVFGNEHQPSHCLPRIRVLIESLIKDKHTISAPQGFLSYLSRHNALPDGVSPLTPETPCAHIALSLGGDGTFLNTARIIGARRIPILGVNTGHLGYLAEVDIDNAAGFIARITTFGGGIPCSERSMLVVEGIDTADDIMDFLYALNEVAIVRQDSASMIYVNVRIDGHELADYPGDGLIISTPTGSTGYNLSVGGPIVSPSAPVWAISPIAPHSLTMRPLVVDDSTQLEITARCRTGFFRVSLDGRSTVLPVSSTLRVGKAPFPTLIVSSNANSFIDTLRSKLLWGSSRK